MGYDRMTRGRRTNIPLFFNDMGIVMFMGFMEENFIDLLASLVILLNKSEIAKTLHSEINTTSIHFEFQKRPAPCEYMACIQ